MDSSTAWQRHDKMDSSTVTAWPEFSSISTLLYQQFREQSPLCNVTIKVGSWEKRFHWCVLVGSPFFETIYSSNFMEKQTGIIKLNDEWSASLVERSLLFLYGREPEVTESNVDKLLDIAEFLLISELKRDCVDFLRRTEVTKDNCMHLLQLSCLYGFEMKNCEQFILGRLPEVLEQEGMLNATTETVKMLMSDQTLSYVPVQSWFNFIMRWVQKTPERLCNFVDLFHMLDFGECDINFINNIVVREPLVMKDKEELDKLLTACGDDPNDNVIIFQFHHHKYNNPAICLNLRTKILRRIGISMENVDPKYLMVQFECTSIKGVKDSMSPHIYKVYRWYANAFVLKVLTHNLGNGQSSVSHINMFDKNTATYSLGNHQLAVVFNCSKRRVANAVSICSRIPRGVWDDSLVDTSTLYVGKLGEPITEPHAVLTLRNDCITRLCCGENGAIAMLTSDRDCLYIFDESTSELECLQLGSSLRNGDWKNPIDFEGFKDGFVLYDEDSVVSVSRASETASGPKYLMKQIMWEKFADPTCQVKHYFAGGRWYRYRNVANGEYGANLEYVSHEDLTTAEDTTHLPWMAIPIPPQRGIPENIFAVSLPRGTLRCHMDCPHCQRVKVGQRQQKR